MSARVASLAVLAAIALAGVAMGGERPMEDAKKADGLFAKQNWMEARAEYDALFQANPGDALARHSLERAVQCSLNLQLWDDAISRAEDYIAKNERGYYEAIGERFLGALYLRIPHHGTKRAGKFHRGQGGQGVHVQSGRQDRRKSISHYERARELLDKLAQAPKELTREQKGGLVPLRIAVDFDLASVILNRRMIGYGYYGWYGWWGWDWWWWGWGWYDDEDEESSALEDADYEEPRRYNWWQRAQEPPRGIPVDESGNPKFLVPPRDYSARLTDAEKLRFLLDEVIELDTSEKKESAARALMRRAMIARQLYGPDSIRQFHQQRRRYDPMGRPLPADPAEDPLVKIHELERDEALAWVAGAVKRIKLPHDEDPFALLDDVEKFYPQSSAAAEARYAAGLYYQTRQQFPEAIAEYDKVIARYGTTNWAGASRTQKQKIAEAEVAIEAAGVELPGPRAEVEFTYRNTELVAFRAYAFDMQRFIMDGMTAKSGVDFQATRQVFRPWHPQYRQKHAPYERYVGKELFEWMEEVEDDGTHRPVTMKTRTPITRPGAYLIEAEVGTGQKARNLLLVTDVAILYKSMPKKGLVYLADARTGRPLAGEEVTIFEHHHYYRESKIWRDRQVHEYRRHDVRTDARGIVEHTPQPWIRYNRGRDRKHASNDVDAVCFLDDGRMAFSFLNRWNVRDHGRHDERGARVYVVTDRPVYRPLHEVKFKVWVRQREKGGYVDARAGSARFAIYDPKGTAVHQGRMQIDEFGGGAAAFKLGSEPPLGVYRIKINRYWPDARYNAGGLFRVEEYKKPEFEVSVKPESTSTRLGGKIKAKVEARYYFGAPVVAADVTYRVFREDYRHVYAGPAEYDWLYGRGYGRAYYPYHWFGWWHNWGYHWHWFPVYRYRAHFPWGWYGAGDQYEQSYRRWLEGSPRKALRELVATGKEKTDKDGHFMIEIDTARALVDHPNTDSRYTVEVDVRDASRRTISGAGSVIATRRAFYAFMDADRGWYRPGNDVFVQLRCLTADNVPVAAKGEITAYAVNYRGRRNHIPVERAIESRRAATDAEGRFSTKFTFLTSGQYRLRFKTTDDRGQAIEANALVWVAGPDFEGKHFRFADLEVITDRREYEVGDVAHLMINTDSTDTAVLLSLEANRGQIRSYELVEVPGRSKVFDITITKHHVPNFFVEATTIHGGRVFEEMRQVFVPPKRGMLDVEITSDKEEYRPGEKGKITIKVRDKFGISRPAQVALVAYDKSVTYIQPEFGPDMRTFFWGQKRYHWPQHDCTLEQRFWPDRAITRMEWWLRHPLPLDWGGWGAQTGVGLTQAAEFKEAGIGGGAVARRSRAKGARREVAADAAAPAASPAEAEARGSTGTTYGKPVSGPMGGEEADGHAGKDGAPPMPDAFAEAAVRAKFADTALWLADVKVDETGSAEAEITFPENLTTWRVRAHGITKTTAVGSATREVVTTKNLIVRLQSPRFFVERDEVVLSANVHNYLAEDKRAKVSLTLEGGCLEAMGELETMIAVEANGEARVDFPVKVVRDGLATITATALTDEESDAMKMAFPALVHGIDKTVASSASFKVEEEGAKQVTLPLPTEINPDATELVVTLSPSLAGAMIDALPYLAGYPYGCVEQTLSRFVPTVVVKKALADARVDLETVGRKRLELLQRRKDVEHRWGRHRRNPVFDTEELDRMVRAGLDRIYSFQHADGGWGWWKMDESSPYTTAYVVESLRTARDAGVQIDGNAYSRGVRFLTGYVDKDLKEVKEHWWYGGMHLQAYLAYLLSAEGKADREWLGNLVEERAKLNLYSKAFLAMALHRTKMRDKAALVLRNILQFIETDAENDTAWVRTPQHGWWYWWNSDIETNARVLAALAEIEPKSDVARGLVKWLLNNRRNGYYWRSTRDTALVIAAMMKYMKASGEGAPDYTVFVTLDGKRELLRQEVTPDTMFTFDNRVTLRAADLPPGPHTIEVKKVGTGALYYSTYLSFFTKEEDIEGAGNEVFVDRTYFKMLPVTEAAVIHPGEVGRERAEARLTYIRTELKTGDAVKSGEMIEVVLNIRSKNDYDFLVFEDMKPAGCEPVELRSGGRWAGGLCANVELRDTKVVFFIGLLQQGEHVLKYRLRAETPGKFHALPTKGWAMYAPEIKTISDEMRLGIED
jgi:uncharacterized protein YfaS (alpha-2-macroglobulin family)